MITDEGQSNAIRARVGRNMLIQVAEAMSLTHPDQATPAELEHMMRLAIDYLYHYSDEPGIDLGNIIEVAQADYAEENGLEDDEISRTTGAKWWHETQPTRSAAEDQTEQAGTS